MSVPHPVSARGLGVRRGGRWILADVDLEVRAAEVVALVGPNGAGKSTLLGCLAGDTEPDTGVVRVDGVALDDWRLPELSRRRAVLLQENRLAFGFTLRAVVAMGRAPWRGRPEEDDDEVAVAAASAAADLDHLEHRSYPSLSGGEKARTSFARTLAQRAGLLLLDEPTAALDIAHQESVLTTVRTVAADGGSAVVVLHDLTLAGAYADRVVLLGDGRVCASGAPSEVLEAGLLTDVYGHPVEVVEHPSTGDPVVLPVRSRRCAPSEAR